MSKRKRTSDGDSPGAIVSPPATRRVRFQLSDQLGDIVEPITHIIPGKMVKRRRSGGKYPMSDARALAHENMVLNQWDPDNARGSSNSVARYGHTMQSATPSQRYNRKLDGFKGRGDYKALLAAGSRGLGYGIGSYFGNGQAGANWGAKFSKWAGWGRYRRRRKNYRGRGDYAGDAGGNQIMGVSRDPPITVNGSDDLSGDVYLSHREFLGNVTALGTGTSTPSAFNLVSYPLNVGLEPSFPWLSQIAQNFTLYELIGCIFEYKPTSGELGSASNALGKVVMATQYDPDAPNFTSTVQMENYDYSNACKPSEHMLHGVETASKQKATNMMYIRTGPSSKDKVFTDYGVFQIATEGLPVNVTSGTVVNVGELWVTYKVKLSRALLFGSLLNLNVGTDSFIAQADAVNITGATGTLVNAAYSGIYSVPPGGFCAPRLSNTIGATISSGSLNGLVLTFPQNIVTGYYMVQVNVRLGAAAANAINIPTPLAFCTCPALAGPITAVSGTNLFQTQSTAAEQNFSATFFVKVTAPGTNQASLQITYVNNVNLNSVSAVTVTAVPSTLFSA